jgi:hypothetical protein
LAISSQLNAQQSAPSASQPIGQTPSVIGHSNTQGSAETRTSTAPDPQPRVLGEHPPETPAEVKEIE